jgi:cysteine-rich CPXCG protein
MQLEPVNLQCPYCGEPIELLIDYSEQQQQYIEDCQVCCRPINVAVDIDDNGVPNVMATTENE